MEGRRETEGDQCVLFKALKSKSDIYFTSNAYRWHLRYVSDTPSSEICIYIKREERKQLQALQFTWQKGFYFLKWHYLQVL